MANLYIIGTPIGNLEDVSQRALRILSEVDLILCEDTRVTKKLLDYYKIKTLVSSYHQHSKVKKINQVIDLLKKGKNLALVSDAGTPGISDPGNMLINKIVTTTMTKNEECIDSLKIIPIPGPSAIITAASVSGFPMDKFLFLGFPPVKKKRQKFLKEIVDSKYPVVFFESRHRIIKTLIDLKKFFQVSNFKFQVIVCRELTKKFETIYRGNIEKVTTEIEKDEVKGEFTIIVRR